MDKIEVVHEGWEHLDRDDGEECEPFPFEHEGYVLFLGSYRKHKNLGRLLEAFQLAAPRIPAGKRLVIAGSSSRLSSAHRTIVEAINFDRERVIFTGSVSNSCLRRLYSNADAFIMPSLAEGFGLPVLEAFHAGAPVLCSRTTSLPEVAGEAALYFDPYRPADIARAVVEFYRQPALRTALIEAGRKRLSLFSWKKSAAETVELYKKCLDHRS
jgi:alpha-1,3-rhamnosyl/mannosyltransferase